MSKDMGLYLESGQTTTTKTTNRRLEVGRSVEYYYYYYFIIPTIHLSIKRNEQRKKFKLQPTRFFSSSYLLYLLKQKKHYNYNK